ncbi:DNA primase (plasmid) [Thermaerobacter sp. FW80]|uniref:phage/plasmid primase, P4 family n=1 Tax=Thermaerobacter sp. FW80 TaxID=2546351 RepID=UPI0010756B17|nr:phage/plasmid primase, P4 family [Thermaerobacter sp. FW80]QBS38740.1 DNA primase [Thermaerobacter sp. FW80]
MEDRRNEKAATNCAGDLTGGGAAGSEPFLLPVYHENGRVDPEDGGGRGGLSRSGKAALFYAERLGWAVFPVHSIRGGRCTCGNPSCDSPGKHPVARLAPHGVKDATKDPDIIRRWWTRAPWANVAVATGAASGFIVLDVDGEAGEDSLEALVAEHGPLPDTVEGLTGGGGRHLLFRHPGRPVGNKVGLAPGLDVRGDGGYIVVPPSVHASGRRYEWEVSSRPDEHEPAEAPGWLLDLLTKAAAPAGEPGRPDWRRRLAERVKEGERNDTLARAVGGWLRAGMDPKTVLDAALALNKARFDPPLPEDEVLKVVESITRREAARREAAHREAAEEEPAVTVAPDSEHLTDLGNARRLVARHGRDLRYCHPWGRWLVWDGRRWRVDDVAEVERRAKDTVRAMYAEAAGVDDPERRKALAKHAMKSESAARIRAMLELAASEPGVPVLPDDLDGDPWLLNVENGTLDLRTGELRPHRREDYLTKLAPVKYDPDARAPRWEAFLRRVLADDADLIQWVQKAVGYTLTGDVSEHVTFIAWGPGANGKTVFFRTLLALFGPYGKTVAPDLLMMRRRDSHPTVLADLFGARLAVASETEEDGRLNEPLLKAITGGDRVKARHMRQDYFEFEPTHKVWLATNHKPVIHGTDYGVWRRIRLIPFTVTIPEDERDPHLADKLREELPGILRWAVEGCLLWQREGLKAPEAVRRATEAYREEMDVLAQFIADACVLRPDAVVAAKDLYSAYLAWCEVYGERPMSQRAFGLRMAERGFEKTRTRTGFVYYGIDVPWHYRGAATEAAAAREPGRGGGAP